VVQRGRRIGRDEIALLRWLLHSRDTAVAVLREGRVTLETERFAELGERAAECRWVSGAHARTRYPDLRALAVAEARELSPSSPARSCRFECRGGMVIELRIEPLRTATGRSTIVLARDASEQVRKDREHQRDRESRLHEQRMHTMGVVASGVAHDLNHWLNVLALRIARLEADPGMGGAREALDSMAHVVDEAAATVARLQDLARRRRDRPREAVDLTAVLLGAIEMARSDFDRPGPQIHIDADVPPLPLVRGTAAELTHLFSDLLLNARDAMPRGGTIEVRARESHGTVTVTIADEGRGIPEEHLLRVFDPFFSTSETRETGLSLSIAYGLLHRLGGDISAANRPGRGTLFTMHFPVASRLPGPRARRRSEERRRLRVLLVDDEADNLEVLRELLGLEGHEAHAASSGRAALDLFRHGERYDLVLCDVGMPEMSGWQVVRELHRIDPAIRVYLLTGWANEIGEHDPRVRDVCGVLAKPLDLDELRSVLAEPCERAVQHADAVPAPG
jgi:signal transduction histidine kinase/ActR/RegA family two-component response regulator